MAPAAPKEIMRVTIYLEDLHKAGYDRSHRVYEYFTDNRSVEVDVQVNELGPKKIRVYVLGNGAAVLAEDLRSSNA